MKVSILLLKFLINFQMREINQTKKPTDKQTKNPNTPIS